MLFIFLFIVIFYVENSYELQTTNISQIDTTYLNKIVKIEGKVLIDTKFNKTLFLEIEDINLEKSRINGIVFNSDFRINRTKIYFFEGKITLYKKEPEIIVEKFWEK